MANYYMQGGDGKEYGPTSAAQLRQWVLEGRANVQTVVRDAAGGPYMALGTVPELTGAATTPAPAAPLASFAQSQRPSEYFMRGGDGKEYGPVTAQQLRQWVLEGRANAQTMVRDTAGGPYVALGAVPELTGAAAATPSYAQSRGSSEYFMRGGDGKEYGPVSATQLRQWLLEGRANAQTLVRDTAGGPFLALGMIPELTGSAAAGYAAPAASFAQRLAQGSALSETDAAMQVKRLATVVAAGSAWMRALALLMFILAFTLGVTIIGLTIAWLPVWQGIVMWSAATKAQQAVYTGSEQDLAQALEKVRQTYRLGVILAIALVLFRIVMGVIGMITSGALQNLGGGMGGFQ